jgi:hypothetical protein
MPGEFAFDLKAMRARDDINDALGVMQNQRMGMPGGYQPQPQGPTPSMNMQADQRMQTANVNMPMGGGVSANAQFGDGQNMPYGMQNVGVNYNAPSGFGAGLSYSPQQKAIGANLRVPFRKGGLAMAEGGGAWTRKEGQNPEGGLNAKGRASLRAQGQDIKPPVSAKQAKKSPKAAARRKSFCARMSGMPGAMKDDNGKPTRKALALRKWDCKAEGGMVEGYAEGGASRVNEAGNYTKPGMRKRLFENIKSGGSGGAPGQWSGRKAQMLAKKYKESGGGYK